jgi:hypothetical protein
MQILMKMTRHGTRLTRTNKMNTDNPHEHWIKVQHKIRKYKAQIQSIHVPGSDLFQKKSNLSQVLAKKGWIHRM